MANENQHNSPIAVRYARALLNLANQRQQAEQIRTDLTALGKVLDGSPAFVSVLSDPGVSEATRAGLIQRTFTGRATPVLVNFLGLLNSKGRLGLLREIISAYDDLLEEQLGNVEVDVTVARQLDAGQLEQVRQRVSQAIGRHAIVQQHVDESIIGGLILRVQDRLIDASVRFQLEQMRRQLLAAAPK
jgi:F-type H+-transporting ATPase subunit delta